MESQMVKLMVILAFLLGVMATPAISQTNGSTGGSTGVRHPLPTEPKTEATAKARMSVHPLPFDPTTKATAKAPKK
jgi:hypothetical protein